MMLLMASVTLTSCQEFWDDLFGVESTPSTPTTPSTPSEPEEPKDDKVVTETPTGAEATVGNLADITDLLDEVKDDIAEKAKSGEEYEFTIKNDDLETTATDNTIEVPRVEDSNINLNFTNGVSTQKTLVVKAAEAESETPTEAVNALTITMPAATTGLNLELNMPETTVTLKAASGEVVYDEVVATTAIQTLYIESGVTVKNLQVKGGIAVVKEGGKAETYVHSPDNFKSYYYTTGIARVYRVAGGVTPIQVQFSEDSNRWSQVIHASTGTAYEDFANLKILKGADTDSTWTYFSGGANYTEPEKARITKFIIGEGAVAMAAGCPSAQIIEGEGKGGEILIESQNNETITSETDGKTRVNLYYYLYNVEEMKNVTVSWNPLFVNSEQTKDADEVCRILVGVPKNAVNCTFNFDEVQYK